jgi:HK97 family phage prohead protease
MRTQMVVRCALKARSASGQAGDGTIGEVEGYGSVFDVEDWYGHVIRKGAFAATLAKAKEEGRAPAMLWQHRAGEPIGVWDELREDDRGLYVRGRLADTALGRDVHTLLSISSLDGLSIGYTASKWTIDDKNDVIELLEVDLWEVSPVTFPANERARITEVKAGEPTERELERALRATGCTRATAKQILAHGFRSAQREAESAPALVAQREAADLAQLCASLTTLAATMRPSGV